MILNETSDNYMNLKTNCNTSQYISKNSIREERKCKNGIVRHEVSLRIIFTVRN